MNRNIPFNDLKLGLSGLMRAKNESRFIEASIDSCIEALDELIVVYNDCTDDTAEILERKKKQYPDKLRVFAFNNNILSHNLTKEEFEYAINLPEDSPRLHSTQCNYALSKVSYKYAIKIDPDQVYFSDELKKWRDVCSEEERIRWSVTFLLGYFFMMYISLYRRLSVKVGFPCLFMIPVWFINLFRGCYGRYIKWRLQKGNAAISFSGVNLFYDGKIWTIPFDHYNINPPYNGEGDTLLFRVSERTYFTRYYDLNRMPYTVAEVFSHNYKTVVSGSFIWFHLHANRIYCEEKVRKTKFEHPELFVKPEKFVALSNKQVQRRINFNVPTLFQRILFALVHNMGIDIIRKHLWLLNGLEKKIGK